MRRVGILALIQESNTFLRGTTTLDHFRADMLLTGDEIRREFRSAHHEISGFFDGLSQHHIDAVPLFAARALPFGTIEESTFETLMRIMFEQIEQAGHLDGILVAPHGATVSERFPDADGEWLSRIREYFGPEIPIIGTLDPHGNLSPDMVAVTDALIAYQTNPHVDQRQRGTEAATLMAETLAGRILPVQSASFPPMAMNIERQCTSESPCRELSSSFDLVRRQTGVVAASLMFGFPYADVTEMGSSALVVTNNDPSLAIQLANQLGSEMWKLRQGLAGTFLSVEQAVSQAVLMPEPVCLLDMGDNVGGGAPGDGTWISHELTRTRIGPAFVCIDDAAVVSTAEAIGVGNKGTFSIGGKADHRHGPPLEAEFTVQSVADGRFVESEVRHGGFTEFDQGRTAILVTENELTVMVTSKRTPPFSLGQLTAFGLNPRSFRILVAKGVNAPLAAYRAVCPSFLRVNTHGVTMADMTQLPYQQRRRPMFPFEPSTTWQN